MEARNRGGSSSPHSTDEERDPARLGGGWTPSEIEAFLAGAVAEREDPDLAPGEREQAAKRVEALTASIAAMRAAGITDRIVEVGRGWPCASKVVAKAASRAATPSAGRETRDATLAQTEPSRDTGDVRRAIRGKPLGRRTGKAMMLGLDRVATTTRIRKPGEGLELLVTLYNLGARYHRARTALDKGHEAARGALASLYRATSDAQWRSAVPAVLAAADDLEVACGLLGELVGVEMAANAAADGAAALTAIVRRDDFEAPMRWRSAEASMVPVARFGRAARQRGRRVQRRSPSFRKPSFTAARLSMLDPRAAGAIGGERVVTIWRVPGIGAALEVAAWHGWCSAGLRVSWDHAWDVWPLLDQFDLGTIGRARSAPGDPAESVRASRRRAHALSPKPSRPD